MVPADDYTTYRYNFTTQPPQNPRGYGGPVFFTYPTYPFEMMPPNGIVPRPYNRANDYQIDRDAQKGMSYSGIRDFRSQDAMATETAGPIYDRTREHLGSTDVALIRMHRLLLRSAKALAARRGRVARAGPGTSAPSGARRRSWRKARTGGSSAPTTTPWSTRRSPSGSRSLAVAVARLFAFSAR